MNYVAGGGPIWTGNLLKRTTPHEEIYKDDKYVIIVVYEYETGHRQYPIKGYYELRAQDDGYYFSVECDNRDEIRILVVSELIKYYEIYKARRWVNEI